MAGAQEPSGKPLWEPWVDALKAATGPLSVYRTFLDQWRTAANDAAGQQMNFGPADFLQTFFGGPAAPGAAQVPGGQYKRFVDAFSGGTPTANPLSGGLELWIAGAAQYGRMAQPWMDFMQQAATSAASMNGPAGAGDPLGAALERSFGLLGDFPGLNTELPALLRAAAGNLLALQRAREGYRVIMAATWQRAFEEIGREVLQRAAGDSPVVLPSALLSLATSVADRVFVETFGSERYISAQHDLATALADQRQCEARIVDLFARSGHFPTRREHDEALREISELRRDIHALKRAVRSFSANAPAAPVPAAPGQIAEHRDGNGKAETNGVAATATPRANGSAAEHNSSAAEPNGSAAEPSAATVGVVAQSRDLGAAEPDGASGKKAKRRNSTKAGRRAQGYAKRNDHGK